ncbi:Y-family DNA polymerase [Candidatus Saccharibacteria bacterium]|nr:Y-family DNA polymerase [Candidatus Saccharibacteria bacterium]
MLALIDSNNFFVSCERLFRPDLAGRPVVVLSSNDGCAVSRSNEAKALGIPMGAPIFKYRELFKRHGVVAFSANFELYGDISERISTLLTSITPHIENYSVDEAFLDLDNLDIKDYTKWGRAVRATVLQYIGIPVSIGIAPTKTLTKLAADWAKIHPETEGALHWPERDEGLLRSFDVHDVWGVGWRLAPQLKAQGVFTALDLSRMDPRHAQQLMGIHGRHMVYELGGTRCLPLQQRTKPQLVISRGRQFGRDTSDISVVEAAVTTMGVRAAQELRREGQLAYGIGVSLRTNRHKPGYTSSFEQMRLVAPTADTGVICSGLVKLVQKIFRPEYSYHKSEVYLYDLVSGTVIQTDVFGQVDISILERQAACMQALDAINAKHGPGSLRPATEAMSDRWQPRRDRLSPRYTSAWSDIPQATLSAVSNARIHATTVRASKSSGLDAAGS